MHFHITVIKRRACISIIVSVALTLISLCKVIESKGYTYIDHGEPYKSYVGRILSEQEGDENSYKIRRDSPKATTSNHKDGPHLGRSSKKAKGEESHSQKPVKNNNSKSHESKGRGMSQGSSPNDKGKPSWYFSDPKKHLGKSVKYEPSDPNEPDPSAKIQGRGLTNGDSGSPGTGGIDAKSNQLSSDSSANLKIIDFGSDAEVDPNAPGWFALKENSDFGTRLSLGSLLRKKTKKGHTNDTSDETDKDDNTSDVADADDGKNNDISENMSPLHRKYDKACSYLEYLDAKEAVVPPKVSEVTRQKIISQNHLLSEFFLDMAFNVDIDSFSTNPLNTQEPVIGFELLMLTKTIFFEQICKDREFDEEDAKINYKPEKDKLLPKNFVEGVVHLFLKLHSITRSTEVNDYLDGDEKKWIKDNLDKCNQTQGRSKKILWFPDECKETVIAFDQENNYACTPYLEYDFDIKKYDPILDFMWHMITAVHSHCFEGFQNNIRMWHRYALAMADLFPPEMRLRWSSSSIDYKKLYTKLFGPHYEVYFDNMNRCMYAASLRSNAPYLLPRFEGDRKTRFAPRKFMKVN